MKTTPPALLLSRAILKKLRPACFAPCLYMFVPSIAMDKRRNMGSWEYYCLSFRKPRIFIEMAYEGNEYRRHIFVVTLSNITDYTNPVSRSINIHGGETVYAIDNFSIAISQATSFVTTFLTFSQWFSVSLNTMSRADSCDMTIKSFVSPPRRTSVLRWLLPKM